MNFKKFITLHFLLSLLQVSIVSAQVWPGPHPLLSSHIKMNVESHIASQVDTLEDKFGYEKAEIQFGFPLYKGKDWLTSNGNTPLIGVTLQGAAAIIQPVGGFLSSDKLLRARLGSNFIYSKGLRNLYMVSLQGILAHELNEISLNGLYMNGSAFWRHRQNDEFDWTVGVAYTSVYAYNKLLPIIGLQYRPTKEDLISILLPITIQYTHFFSNATSISATIKPNGGFYNVHYPENDINDATFRHKNMLIAVILNHKLSYQFSIQPELGIQTNTKLFVNDFSTQSATSVFARIAFRYKFGRRVNVAPILDFDPADFTTADSETPEK